MLTIKAFQAIQEPELARAYVEGHESVLASYGIPKISSSSDSWTQNPNVYALVVLNEKEKVVGGARIHIRSNQHELPIENAINKIDPDFRQWMTRFSNEKIGEMCGLWNSRSISGKGVSQMLMRSAMAKSGIVIANQLNLNALMGLCAPWTLPTILDLGFTIEESVGDKGAYAYPRPDLLATVTIVKDTDTLWNASMKQRKIIFDLRNFPNQKKIEESNGNRIDILYSLLIPGLDD